MLTIHKASAGSGKTYSLTYTYIKLLLGDKDPMTGRYALVRRPINRHRAILAITFTNKATEEMKSRIIKRLTELAMRQACEYEDDLCREFSCRLNDLQDCARQALGSLLADYTQFHVTTIDAFFQGVLRSFARELNVSATYEVDLDSKRAITVGVKEMLSSINRTSERSPQWKHVKLLTSWLTEYMEEQLTRGNNISVFRPAQGSERMVNFIDKNLDETYRLNIDEIKGYTSDITRIQRFNKALATKIRSITDELNNHIGILAETVSRYGFDPKKFSTNPYKNIIRWEQGNYDVKSTAGVYKEAIEKRYVKPKRKADVFDIPDEVDQAFCNALRYGVENIPLLKFYEHVRDDLFNFGILADVEQKTTEYLRDNQSILIDNTQSLLRRIINRDETPFIYERIGMQLRHFLIDEFQDTSRLQWLNLAPLVEDSVDSGNDNLIIGDEKQSIYRFRNADPQLITETVPREFFGRSIIKGTASRENTNYRSAWHIVGFNNTVFAGIAYKKNLLNVYANTVQTIKKADLPGYVVMSPYKTEVESLEFMAENIKRQLATGYRQRDIAILADKRAQAYAIVNFLLDRAAVDDGLKGIQIMTQEALRIESSPAIRRIISILRYIDSIQSVNNYARGHMTPQQQLAAVINRFELLRGQGYSHGDALTEAFSESAVSLDEASIDIVKGEYTTLPSMIELIIERFTDAEERDTQNIYLSAFQDMVNTFTSRGSRGVHQFIKWWDETGSKM
ncbi:MAG: UvrD-helicase domain-containing protein, partial [Muribaculum sp.]|nr:UvrD-helicase domain-containing protein [Muribaculum sp.]